MAYPILPGFIQDFYDLSNTLGYDQKYNENIPTKFNNAINIEFKMWNIIFQEQSHLVSVLNPEKNIIIQISIYFKINKI